MPVVVSVTAADLVVVAVEKGTKLAVVCLLGKQTDLAILLAFIRANILYILFVMISLLARQQKYSVEILKFFVLFWVFDVDAVIVPVMNEGPRRSV